MRWTIFFILLISINTALALNITSPTKNILNPSDNITINAELDFESSCNVWGYIYTPSGKKFISPRECKICSKGSGGIYTKNISAYFDTIEGSQYEIYVTCTDRNDSRIIKKVLLNITGEMNDAEKPIITIINPQDSKEYFSNLILNFSVNELSHCKYETDPDNYIGRSGEAFSGYLNNKDSVLSLQPNKNYTLTVTCNDLRYNFASQKVKFTTLNKACPTCYTPASDIPTVSESGGGGQGGGCFDTDGGRELFTKGIAAGIWDSCKSKTTIKERFCDNSEGHDLIIDCPIGSLCKEGICYETSEDGRSGREIIEEDAVLSSIEIVVSTTENVEVTATNENQDKNQDVKPHKIKELDKSIIKKGNNSSNDFKSNNIEINNETDNVPTNTQSKLPKSEDNVTSQNIIIKIFKWFKGIFKFA